MNYKRKKPKSRRAGCLLCKPWKHQRSNYEKKMPFRWLNFEEVKLKIQGRDYIGLIPEYDSLHRAYQLFDKDDRVFDCLYYNNLGKERRKADPFISWKPIEPLFPKGQRTKR